MVLFLQELWRVELWLHSDPSRRLVRYAGQRRWGGHSSVPKVKEEIKTVRLGMCVFLRDFEFEISHFLFSLIPLILPTEYCNKHIHLFFLVVEGIKNHILISLFLSLTLSLSLSYSLSLILSLSLSLSISILFFFA